MSGRDRLDRCWKEDRPAFGLWGSIASPLTAELPSHGCPFYHVHSFAARPRDPGHVVGSTEYGERFATIAARENVLGVQFHPEKSSRHGLRMLRAFVGLCAGGRAERVAA